MTPDQTQGIALLTQSWGNSAGEAGFIVRSVAGALTGESSVEVLLADGSPSRTLADGAFQVRVLRSEPPDLLKTELWLAALQGAAGGRPPEMTVQELGLLRGGPDPGVIIDYLSRRALRSLIIVGCGLAWIAPVAAATGRCGRIVVLESRADRRWLSFLVGGEEVAAIDAFLTTSRAAGWRLRDLWAGVPVCNLGLGMNLEEPRAGYSLFGIENQRYALVLGHRSSAAPEENALVTLLRQRIPSLALMIADPEGLSFLSEARNFRFRSAPTRPDLRQLMAHAVCTIDLGYPEPLGLDAIESLSQGTPIVVRAQAAGRDHAEESAGGLWFESGADLIGCVTALLTSSTRDALAEAGHQYAREEYYSATEFQRKVQLAVLAAEPAGSIN